MAQYYDFKVTNGQVEKAGSGWYGEPKRHSEAAIKGKGGVLAPAERKAESRQRTMTCEDIRAGLLAAQKAAEEKFRSMVKVGPEYAVTVSGGGVAPHSFPLLGLLGFSWIHFSGAGAGRKEANALKKCGYSVSSDYPSGLHFDASRHVSTPEWARKAHPEAGAYFQQSIDLKIAANNGFLNEMQRRGFFQKAYVNERLD